MKGKGHVLAQQNAAQYVYQQQQPIAIAQQVVYSSLQILPSS